MKSVFISYSHTPSYLKIKTLNLVERLLEAGIRITIDHYDLFLGNGLNKFMSEISNEKKYNFILIICTKDYFKKSTNKLTGVGIEMNEISKLLESPDQERVVPVLFEEGRAIDEILPILLKDVYCVDLRNEPNFDGNETKKLINHLKGIKTLKPESNQLVSLMHYATCEYPGMPLDIAGQLKQDLILQIFVDCWNLYSLMIQHKTWINEEVDNTNVLQNIFDEIILNYRYFPDRDISISVLLLLWEIYDNLPNPHKALIVIEEAEKISEEFSKDENYPYRSLEIKYKKGITYHRLHNYDLALSNYDFIMKDESQDILNDTRLEFTLNSALYTGHILMLKNEINEASKFYKSVILTCEKAFERNFPIQLFKDIRNIYYCALYSINDKTREYNEKLLNLENVIDADFVWYKSLCKSFYPRLFALRIMLLPDIKPEIEGWIEGIHYRYF